MEWLRFGNLSTGQKSDHDHGPNNFSVGLFGVGSDTGRDSRKLHRHILVVPMICLQARRWITDGGTFGRGAAAEFGQTRQGRRLVTEPWIYRWVWWAVDISPALALQKSETVAQFDFRYIHGRRLLPVYPRLPRPTPTGTSLLGGVVIGGGPWIYRLALAGKT